MVYENYEVRCEPFSSSYSPHLPFPSINTFLLALEPAMHNDTCRLRTYAEVNKNGKINCLLHGSESQVKHKCTLSCTDFG